MTQQNAYQFSFKLSDDTNLDLSQLQGKVILIVNTASKCGFTTQYASLQQLYDNYKDQGLVVIGVPSADFGNQEFADIDQVNEFTNTEFVIDFPLAMINHVKGKDAHPFYLWANKKAGFLGSPKWNFHKYLIDKEGNFAAWFSSPTKPDATKIINKIELLL